MRMYFRTDYHSYVATIDGFVQLKKGNTYEVLVYVVTGKSEKLEKGGGAI